MNKLNTDTVEYLQKLIKTCLVCGIDSVAIEPGLIRAQSLDNARGTFLLKTDIPKFDFDNLGIGRVKILSTRLALLDTDAPTVEYDGKQKDNGDFLIYKLKLSNKKTKAEFSCYDPMKIKAPRKFNDVDCYSFTINKDTLLIMNKVSAALETTKISFSNNKDGAVVYRTTDREGDMFDHIVADTHEKLPGADKENFFHEYEVKYLLPLFKGAIDISGNLDIIMTMRGILKMSINSFDIYVLPEVK
jgi:hypothetical protein